MVVTVNTRGVSAEASSRVDEPSKPSDGVKTYLLMQARLSVDLHHANIV